MTPLLTHVAFHVKDVEACIQFYKEFCSMKITHHRKDEEAGVEVVWMAEPGKEQTFIIVMVGKGQKLVQAQNDYNHLGFAVKSKEEVDRLAKLAQEKDCLFWSPRQEDYPVGYYCGVVDPNGNVIEFSYGQPLGPGSPDYDLVEN